MSYNAIIQMANSASLQARVVAAAAALSAPTEAKPLAVPGNPQQWVASHIWQIVASGSWGEKWDKAATNPDPKYNPDTGARSDVITDAMIEKSVKKMLGDLQPAEDTTEPGGVVPS